MNPGVDRDLYCEIRRGGRLPTQSSIPREETQLSVREQLEAHHGQAFGWCVTCCRGDVQLAEDVLQTAYLKILEGRARFAGRSSFRTWLFSVVRNTARDSWRARFRRHRPLAELEHDPADAGAAGEQRRVDLLTLDRAVGSLPRRQAELLTLVYGYGLTLDEAAVVMRVTPGTAATHLHRGKKALRSRMGQREERS